MESLKGKYVLVNFWATWCAPCIAELPHLQEAYRKYHDAGFEILSVSLDETRTAVADFVRVRKLPWPQLHNGTAAPISLKPSPSARSPPRTLSIQRAKSFASTCAARQSKPPSRDCYRPGREPRRLIESREGTTKVD